MKKILLLFFSLAVAGFAMGQQWTKNLSSEKSSAKYTLHDYQNAFYSYWKPFDVKNGYYLDNNGEKRKAAGWKQFKRWENYWEPRVNPITGEFPNADINAIYKQEKRESAFKSSGELWTSHGPNSSIGGYFGIGRINTIAFHPTDPDTFWAGTASGGLWATTDGGNSWSVLNDDMQALGVSDIVIPSDYATSHTLYLATGDRDAYDTRSIGLLKSTDAGASWESIGIDFNAYNGAIINRVLLDPSNNTTLVVAGNFGVYKSYYSKGKSSDQTQAWSKISDEIFIDMEAKPGDFNTLYGSTKTGGIFVTTNGGELWTKTLNLTVGNRIEMAVSPDEPTWVYAIIVSNDDGLHSIYKSEDSGQHFVKIFDGMAHVGDNLLGWDDGTDAGGQGWYDLSLAASPTDANTVLLGGINTWMSVDGGLNWDLVNHWYGGFNAAEVHADKHFLGFQASSGKLFEGNDGGIYQTSDYNTWTDLSNGIVNSQMYKLSTSATVPGETIAGLQDNGTKLYYQGDSWEDVKGGDGTECIIDYTDVAIQYGAYVNGQISKTTTRWFNSTDISANIPGGPDGAWVTPYIINPKDPLKLYVGYTEVWKTNNRGASFKQLGSLGVSTLRSMAIAPSDTSRLYVATYTKISKSENSGSTWVNITSTLPVGEASITSIAVKDTNPNTIWITMSGYSGYGVWQTVNGGLEWENISTGLPGIPCNTIVQNKLNTTDVELYVGTDVGVYMKLGQGNWQAFSTGLPNVVVSELEIYYDPSTPKNSLLKAATYGRGLWETKVYDSGVQIGLNVLEQIGASVYPNPTNGKFKVDFADFDMEPVELKIVSLTGKVVYQSILSQQSNNIDLGFIANGVYVLQVKKGNQWHGQNILVQN